MKHVFLGRFAPFHEGHKILLIKLVSNFGINNCIVMIGSSNVINDRTPYQPEERKEMIKEIFSKIKIIYIPDVGDDILWLENLKKLEKEMNEKFIFYGGSLKDLEVLSREFKIIVLVDRLTEGKGISGTKIRSEL